MVIEFGTTVYRIARNYISWFQSISQSINQFILTFFLLMIKMVINVDRTFFITGNINISNFVFKCFTVEI